MRPPAVRHPFDPGSLTDAAHAPALYDRYPQYEQVMDWVQSFVTQPHADLGRPGAVCPRMAPALRLNLVRLVALRTKTASVDEAGEKGGALAALYEELFDDAESFRAGALMAVFPDLPEDQADTFIDGGHARLRMNFVARGLMIGEFHPHSTVTSVRNPALHVMRCPAPMFAVRALSRHDLIFLDRPETPPAERGQYLKHLLHHLGDQLTDRERDRIQAGFAELEGAK
ncbi:DUF6875 domain-containing protein [Streptomyces sp. NPDC051662]|uniref:DUF6875 domain-containing protein n=1 Tax=Streptomyces sp. NPDC051662 TaxID=3154750 RepID=UPI0034350675